jgi:hypothetical protein
MVSFWGRFILNALKSALKMEEMAGGFAIEADIVYFIASDGVGWRSTRPSGSLNGPASDILSLGWSVSTSLACAAFPVHTNFVAMALNLT